MIIHVFNSSIVSGPETLVLPALKNLGETVSIIFLSETRLLQESKGPVAYARSLGHTVHEIAVSKRWDKKAFRKLRLLLDELKPEIVHAHDVKASLYLLQAKKEKPDFKPRIVSTHHGASYRKGKIKLYEEFYVRYALPKFDLSLAVCKADLQSMVKRGVSKDKIQIHLNGTQNKFIEDSTRSFLQKTIRAAWKEKNPALRDADHSTFLGAVARLSPEKRHDRMLHVLHELKTKPSTQNKSILLCFGVGPEINRLKALSRKLQVEDLVFWMGYSPTIGQEMAGFDLMLCLSDGEGIPINLLEAGWAATPVLSTAVGGIPDLMNHDESGILVQKNDSNAKIAKILNQTLNDPNKLRRLGKNYQSRVSEQFSEKAWIERLQGFYREIRQ